MAKRYTIKEAKAKFYTDQPTEFLLSCDGDWIESFRTRDAAETEMVARQGFEKRYGRDHGRV